jgi:hypothetical protein
VWRAQRSLVVLTFSLFALGEDTTRIQPGTPADRDGHAIVGPRTVESEDLVATKPYKAITVPQRAEWWAERSLDWESFGAGIIKGATRTWWLKSPEEWGGSWEGFGKRVGTRQAESIISRGIEAGVGSLWGEDPRYFRSGRTDFSGRLRHAVVSAFVTYRRDGSRGPALARGIGIVSAKTVSKSWKPDREWWQDSFEPLGTGLAGRITSNVLREFLPDLKHTIFRTKKK